MSQTGHICFYSNSAKDKASKAFLEQLATTPWSREFQFICVDGKPRDQLPKWLKEVPTLVISGEKEPVKTFGEAMNWLFERKMREAPAKAPTAAAQTLPGQDVASWNGGEMGGLGDAGYSFLDSDTSTGGNGGASIPGTFSFLNGGASPGDRSGQEVGRPQQQSRSKKEAALDAQYEMFMQQRDMGMPKGPNRQ